MAEAANGGSGADASNPDNPPSGTGGGTGGIENLIQAINTVLVSPSDLDVVESAQKSFVLTATVATNKLNESLLTFQWQKKLPGGSFTDIAGETGTTFIVPSGVTVTADNNTEYRCQVSHVDAVTSPITSNNAAPL